jgi:peptidyl-dipeptidase Dcp
MSRMRQHRGHAALAGLAAGALSIGAAAQQPPRDNPLLQPTTLLYGVPRFDRVASADFRAALEQGMKEELADIDRIAAVAAPPDFANTFEAIERSGALLRRTLRTYNVLLSAHSDSALQAVDAEYSPKLAAQRDAIDLNPQVFARVKSIYDRRQTLGLDAEQLRLVEQRYRALVRAGAALPGPAKERVRAINLERSGILAEFRRRLLAEVNAAAVVVDDKASLDGLPEQDIAAAAAAATARGLAGKWVLPLQNTTQQPALAYLRNRALRERIFRASIGRNASGANDTTALVLRLATLRAERAALQGFPSHAAFTLDDQMAKTPAQALALLQGMVAPVNTRTRDEAARLQARLRMDVPGATLEPWDWQFYAEAVRRADYALDESEVRQYFELDRVLQDGVFFAATKLYGITFRERTDIPVYHPDLRVFDVTNADGSALGLIYLDYFARPSKRGGAWMNAIEAQSGLLGTKSVVTNTANFPKPSAGNPSLLTLDQVRTMFHEFGHGLHGLFANVRYPSLAGTAVSRDFVEMPSQFNEHWSVEPSVFARYARHYLTGEPMPPELKKKIDAAQLFNAGYGLTEQLAASLVDLEWHSLAAAAVPGDVDAFEQAALKKYGLAVREVPPRYRTRYFQHIWTLAYSAGYYSYLWSQVLDTDVYEWFKEHGGLTRENGQRFRDMVLARGGTQDEARMYREFRGRDASVEPLLIQRGLK